MSAADAATTPTANGEPPLSKAELRRRRILAKKGARMALVTGDSALAAADSVPAPAPAVAPVAPAASISAPVAFEPETAPAPAPVAVRAAEAPTPAPTMPTMPRFWKMPRLPDSVRTGMVLAGGVGMPFLRQYVWVRLSALQLFLALEAVMLAPEIAYWGNSGMLGAALGVAKQSSMVWRDLALYLLSLFIVLRYF